MRGAIHVAFEEGTQAQWLHDLLLDADQLSDLLRRGGLCAVYHDRPHREVLKELARTYLTLVQDSTRVMTLALI